jgi:hypothetical protein
LLKEIGAQEDRPLPFSGIWNLSVPLHGTHMHLPTKADELSTNRMAISAVALAGITPPTSPPLI